MQTFEFSSTTAKIPKGYGYILKPSSLSKSLTDAEVKIAVDLTRSHGQHFDAHFWIPNPNVPYERLYIVAGPANADILEDIRSYVMKQALPRLVEWISAIQSLDPKSPIRRQKQYIQLWPSGN